MGGHSLGIQQSVSRWSNYACGCSFKPLAAFPRFMTTVQPSRPLSTSHEPALIPVHTVADALAQPTVFTSTVPARVGLAKPMPRVPRLARAPNLRSLRGPICAAAMALQDMRRAVA